MVACCCFFFCFFLVANSLESRDKSTAAHRPAVSDEWNERTNQEKGTMHRHDIYMHFVQPNKTDHAHARGHVMFNMQMCASLLLYACARLYVKLAVRVSSHKHMLSKGARHHWQSLHHVLLAFAVRMSLTHLNLLTFISTFQTTGHSTLGYNQASSKPCHPALTFLRAENPREMPADELLEMLKTAKLGSVTGNLRGLGLADISDSSLSSQEGLPLINASLPHAEQPQRFAPTVGGWLWDSLKFYYLRCSRKTDRLNEGDTFFFFQFEVKDHANQHKYMPYYLKLSLSFCPLVNLPLCSRERFPNSYWIICQVIVSRHLWSQDNVAKLLH